MNTIDTDAINRRMAELQGWTHPHEAGLWLHPDRSRGDSFHLLPDYCHDPTLTSPLINAEKVIILTDFVTETGCVH